jgi:prophage tail gpP-like protein
MIVRANVTTKFSGKGYSPLEVDTIEAYEIDSSMDTDTDTWTLQIGDPDLALSEVLERDNEVRLSIFGIGNGLVKTLHNGFADEIVLDQECILTFNGRDITAPAVDSKHPPQMWSHLRPQALVSKEARQLGMGGNLKLVDVKPFKRGSTDGGETYWEVWYRFYRKRRMWMYAEPDGALVADTLRYEAPISYWFGSPTGTYGSDNPDQWLPVEKLEWRANKQQRIAEIFVFGHRGDFGFVARATDPTLSQWIKKPTQIIQDSHVHNQAEAKAEAFEELFETKVGANEIKLTIADPGDIIRQNTMAMVNIPIVGLRGEFFVVGTRILGSADQGMFQEVRLREKNYAITRRVPSDPVLNPGTGKGQPGDIAAELSGDFPWKQYFVDAALKFHGPWNFQVFLGVLLAICDQESSFQNKRQGSQVIYPGTSDHRIPSIVADNSEFNKFVNQFANEISFGRTNTEYGVGPMQLTTPGYKHAADKAGDTGVDELSGARWSPQWNIWVGAAALASKLGAGWSISADGVISQTKITGASLDPQEQNIWAGVQAYNGSGPDAVKYAQAVKAKYIGSYKSVAAEAVAAASLDTNNPLPEGSSSISGLSSAELRTRCLSNTMITFTRASQRDDIRYGLIHDEVLRFLLNFTQFGGFPVVITALRSDHNLYTTSGNISAHSQGLAVDLGNYGQTNPETETAMRWINNYKVVLGFKQMIGPVDSLVFPVGYYDQATLQQHDTHIHVGW